MEDIADFLPEYPMIDDPNFNQKLYDKQEFREFILQKNESNPTKSGQLLSNQKFIARFFSSFTPYDQLLLFHEMGTGKGCVTVGAIEQIQKEKNGFKRALILAKNKSMLENYQKELIFKCTEGQYIPDNYDSMTESDFKKKQLIKKTRAFYSFDTFHNFIKSIKNVSIEKIRADFSNYIIVVDEIHNIQPHISSNSYIYRELKKFFGIIHNSKVLLLTGTPMKDRIDEIASLMNLILPKTLQFNINTFISDFFISQNNLFQIKNEEKMTELKSKFKGRISFLRAQKSSIEKEFIKNNIIKTSLQINLFQTKMSEFQTNIYLEMFENDKKQNLDTNIYQDRLDDEEDEEDKDEEKNVEEDEEENVVVEDEEENVAKKDDEEKTEKEEEEYQEEESLIKTRIGVFKNVWVSPDGDCLFRSIQEQLEISDSLYEMRKKVYKQLKLDFDTDLRDNIFYSIKDWFNDNFEDPENQIIDNPEMLLKFYIHKMSTKPKDREINQFSVYWGGDIEISILSKIYKIKIGIISEIDNSIQYHGDFENTIYIYKTDDHYNIAQKVSDGAKTSSFYHHSRQSSLFVFPDESIGKIGFEKYVKKKGTNHYLTNEFKNLIQDSNEEKMLQNINRFSCKISTCLRNVLKAVNEGKKIFIYSEYVTSGGGTVLLSLLLNLFNFTQSNGNERTKGKRYLLPLATSADLQKLFNRFNANDNIHGEYISIIIGSHVLAEGYSFLNIQQEHILTPYWNYAEIDQIIARGIRYGSHNLLQKENEEKGLPPPKVEIFLYCAIPEKETEKSIDLQMYTVTEIKDRNIKMIERFIKESAVDCQFNYNRNYVKNKKNQRECEYQMCKYKCDNVDKETNLDSSTYFLYLPFDKILEIARLHFKENYQLSFNDLQIISQESNIKLKDFIRGLYKICNDKIYLYNKNFIRCFLQADNGIFYLINDTRSENHSFLSTYYLENINYEYDKSEQLESIYNIKIVKLICERLFSLTDIDNVAKKIYENLTYLSPPIQELLLEACLKSLNMNVKKNKVQRQLLLNHFNGFYLETDTYFLSYLLYDDKRLNTKDLRFMSKEENIWMECPISIKKTFNDERQKQYNQIKNNKYGYFGYNKSNKADKSYTFYVEEILEASKHKKKKIGEDEKKNILPRGHVCKTYNKNILFNIMYAIELYPPNDNDWNKIIQSKTITETNPAILKQINEIQNNNSFSKTEKQNRIHCILYWNKFSISNLCNKIQTQMKDKNIFLNYL